MFFERKLDSYLFRWLRDTKRKPLVIRGARQVGKTSIVKSLAFKEGKNLIHINLEDARQRQIFSVLERQGHGISLTDCLRVITDNYLQDKTGIADAILFFDEIQNVPSLIPLLRFFYEERPDLRVIAAGSYFEIRLAQYLRKNPTEYTFPVGRVENLFLYPLDFFEYLDAI